MRMGLNLAARPFTNERPVRRTTLLIWVLALGLLAINVFLYQRHLSGQHEQRQTIAGLESKVTTEESTVRRLEGELTELELSQQNRRVVFLNSQIAKRTFSWSRLFDRLEEVLPSTVQLRRVSPRVLERRESAGLRWDLPPTEVVAIDISGSAQSGEVLLQFVDNLFEHATFVVPNLTSESERDDRRLDFAMDVLYLPSAGEDEVGPGLAGSVEASLPGESLEGQ